ncbi:MAG: HAD family hydrolase [Cyanobacteria bacterium]|nr:HAD family hydrolase [Cyanobacteriota bacterium]MDW8202927.1 HAD family hydrolase [Cyanobacteriota bacterium SKYGB_h_bin112]
MTISLPTILALDFDGVICDGLVEYFQTAWHAYCQVWNVDESTPPAGLAEAFYRLRPVVETGWEMPLVLRALVTGVTEAEILQDWPTIAQAEIAASHCQPRDLALAVDGYRDQWIARDLQHWLDQHRFYPGIVERLHHLLTSPVQLLIITTKEGRFVRELLHQQSITLEDDRIIGKEYQRPKHESLRQVLTANPQAVIWFVEDRLKTLLNIKQYPDLDAVQLFLADWGYNTAAERELAQRDDRIHLLSLATVAQDMGMWPHLSEESKERDS